MALICGYYGKLNFGDELILGSIIQNFSKDYRIVVVSYDAKITRDVHKVESVLHRSTSFDEALKDAAIVIIGGGGLFHDQNLISNVNVSYYCGIIQKAVALGKEVVLFGIGVDNIYLESNRQLIKDAFSVCKAIVVRDQYSKERLFECNVKNIMVAPDLAFGFENKINGSCLEKSKPVVGINLCLPVYKGNQNFLKQITDYLVPFLKSQHDYYRFVFIPGEKKDFKLMAYLKEKTGLEMDFFKPDLHRFLESYFEMLSNCDFIIASRYHFLVSGIILGKPTYALSYAEKTDSLVESFSDYLHCFQGGINKNNFKIFQRNSLENELQNVIKNIFSKPEAFSKL